MSNMRKLQDVINNFREFVPEPELTDEQLLLLALGSLIATFKTEIETGRPFVNLLASVRAGAEIIYYTENLNFNMSAEEAINYVLEA
jgi:hypothetical protein